MKRLGKQRVETLQILNSLYISDYKGWRNHPCREMWRGYENALVRYGQVVCVEWLSRGYKDTCFEKITAFTKLNEHFTFPLWFGDEAFHLSHKSNLIRKKPDHYKPFWPDVPDNLPYIWPSSYNGQYNGFSSR